MNDINKIIKNTLTDKISYSSSIRRSNYDNKNQIFDLILLNSISKMSSANSSCCFCGNNKLNMIDTLLSYSNKNRIYNQQVNLNAENTISLSENNSNNKMNDAINLLNKQLGKKYVWGATGPDSFDCSGLVQYIYKQALGKEIPRVSYEQSEFGKAINKEDLKVGDLVFFDTLNKGRVSHVGMYVGNDEFIHASNKKDGVKKSSLSSEFYKKTYICARRP